MKTLLVLSGQMVRGKSNIVDAIRLGIRGTKSKELRLDQMSSVIFNGTKRKNQWLGLRFSHL